MITSQETELGIHVSFSKNVEEKKICLLASFKVFQTILICLFIASCSSLYSSQQVDKTDIKTANLDRQSRNDRDEELYPIKVKERYGYMDKTGHLIIRPVYDDGFEFSENYARVIVNNKYGFINLDGAIVIPNIYEDAQEFKEGLAGVKQGGLWGYVNYSNQVLIKFEFEAAKAFSEDLAAVKPGTRKDWIYISKKGETIIEGEFVRAFSFSEGLAVVIKKYGNAIKSEFIDKTGKAPFTALYDFADVFSEGLARVFNYRAGGVTEYAYINKRGETAINLRRLQPDVKQVGNFSEGLAYIMIDNKFGFIDKVGAIVIPLEYDWADSFSESLASVSRGDKYGYINKEGRWLISPIYSYAGRFHNGVALIQYKSKSKIVTTYIDKQGNEIRIRQK